MEKDAELLVVVAVLAHDRPGVELDDSQGDPLAVNGASSDPLPDLLVSDRGELVEGRHAVHASGELERISLVPPISILLGWVLLDEAPATLAFAGGALCLVGVATARRG